MEIQIINTTYDGNNLAFLEGIIAKLKESGLPTKNILYRASEQKNLERILKFGTDRGRTYEEGLPKKVWPHSKEFGRVIFHEDVIIATTKEEIIYGERVDSAFQTPLKKFSITDHPLLCVYDTNFFVKLKEKQYLFKNTKNKLDSLLAVFIVNKSNSAKKKKKLYVATGANDCGKTTTLSYLKDFYGYTVHKEAPSIVLTELGGKKLGHPPDKPIKKIRNKNHLCPVCKPLKFAELVFKKQKEIESLAREGDFIDRSYIDAIEFLLRNSAVRKSSIKYKKEEFGDYACIFLFDVMPSIQIPKWGKSVEERVEEAKATNKRLLELYSKEYPNIYLIPPDSIENRAKMIHEIILQNGKIHPRH